MPGAFSGQLYTIAASSRNSGCPVLGAAGEDRTVHVWDPRTWKSVDKWSNCLKYEVTSLHFMSNPAFCVVGGLDYEVVCSRWMGGNDQSDRDLGGQKAGKGRAAGPATDVGSEAEAGRQSQVAASFRGAARWLGLAKSPSSDTFAGITADKTLYCTSFASM
jgi:WD40 repeat protein